MKDRADAGISPALRAGQQLREARARLGITTREVEEYSRKIADEESNDEFYISNAWLTQVENKESVPSIYKLYSLCVIYRLNYSELLRLYGVELESMGKHQLITPLRKTHLATIELEDKERAINFPVRFDPGFRLEKTNLLSRMVEIWGEIPLSLLESLDIRNGQYGYIGLEDFTLYPLIPPGSFVQIDDHQNRILPTQWRTEFDRPIYFIELRESYACSWCDLQAKRLTLIPHPLSPCGIRQFDYGSEAEIVGRVTAVALRIVNQPHSPIAPPAKLQARS
ncbi:MAG: helix-turn-helix domain-containing protein [Candidatus Acidiferrales bacterium]